MASNTKEVSHPRQAAILCGGLGTRLKPHTDNLPKPMISVNGKPFLWYLLDQLSSQKISRFVLLTGYKAEAIEEYFGDGSKWGWEIEYSRGPVEWDTGKRVWEARDKFDSKLWLLYSDNFAAFRADQVYETHMRCGSAITLTVCPKTGGNIALSEDSKVSVYDRERSDPSLGWVEIGYMVVEKDRMLKYVADPECSFSSIIYQMSQNDDLAAMKLTTAYQSISDPKRWRQTCAFLDSAKKVLIDRDGVINKKAPQGEYVEKWSQFRWIDSTIEAMQLLSARGYTFLVVSNQAGVARGKVKEGDLLEIHNRMKAELKDKGVVVEDIFVCPHHWEEKCLCRKPAPGMFHEASEKYQFRLDHSIFIGDDSRDCQAAFNAGCKSIFIGSQSSVSSLENREQPIAVFETLVDAIPVICGEYDKWNNRAGIEN